MVTRCTETVSFEIPLQPSKLAHLPIKGSCLFQLLTKSTKMIRFIPEATDTQPADKEVFLMKKLTFAVACAAAVLSISACKSELAERSEAPTPQVADNSLALAAEAATLEQIKATSDADELLAIVKKAGPFSAAGKAAGSKLNEVLQPKFEAAVEAKSRYDLYQLKKYATPGSPVLRSYDEAEGKLPKDS